MIEYGREIMEPRAISTDKAPLTGFSTGTRAPLSMGIAYNGLLFVSGQGPLDPETHKIVSEDFEEQTRVTLENLLRVVEAAGSSKDRILRCNAYVRDVENFPKFNAVYRAFFESVDRFPARTTVRADPPREGVLVEIDCIAAVDAN
jgi:2-iminobutanoate/2-iminopropanoate deaminase